MFKLHFYALPQNETNVLCYTIRNFEGPSVCQGEHPRFRGYVWAILDIIMKYFIPLKMHQVAPKPKNNNLKEKNV